MGRHHECEGLFLNATGNPIRCTCKQNNHQQPTARMKNETPTRADLIDKITTDLNRVLADLATLKDTDAQAT